MRTRTLLVVSTLVTVVVLGGVGLVRDADTTSPARTAAVTPSAARPAALRRDRELRALRVLHGWDRARRGAWSQGDAARLARLYSVGSQTGGRDIRALARWGLRGMRVRGLRQQISQLHVVSDGPTRLVVLVTERTTGGEAVGRGASTRLPSSAWARLRIRLRRTHGTWRVVEARARRFAQPAR